MAIRWQDIQNLSVSIDEINLLAGLTADASALNGMDGFTGTAAELNTAITVDGRLTAHEATDFTTAHPIVPNSLDGLLIADGTIHESKFAFDVANQTELDALQLQVTDNIAEDAVQQGQIDNLFAIVIPGQGADLADSIQQTVDHIENVSDAHDSSAISYGNYFMLPSDITAGVTTSLIVGSSLIKHFRTGEIVRFQDDITPSEDVILSDVDYNTYTITFPVTTTSFATANNAIMWELSEDTVKEGLDRSLRNNTDNFTGRLTIAQNDSIDSALVVSKNNAGNAMSISKTGTGSGLYIVGGDESLKLEGTKELVFVNGVIESESGYDFTMADAATVLVQSPTKGERLHLDDNGQLTVTTERLREEGTAFHGTIDKQTLTADRTWTYRDLDNIIGNPDMTGNTIKYLRVNPGETDTEWVIISAEEVSYDNSVSELAATNVQDAIDENDFNIDTHIADPLDAHDASAISYDNTDSGLAAVNVKEGLDELEATVVHNTRDENIAGIKTFTDTTESTNKDTGAVIIDGGLGIEKNVNIGGSVLITGDLQVDGTTTTFNTETMEVEDANILVNKGGTQATADAQDAGLTISMSDATDTKIGYDSATESKWAIDDKEVVTVSDTQELTNKRLTLPEVNEAVDLTATSTELNQLTGITVGGNGPGDILTTDDAQTVTNKTFDADSNTFTNFTHGNEVDNPVSGVHGVIGNVVGDSDVQTLTEKTLTLPKVNEAVNLTATSTELNQLDGVEIGGDTSGDVLTTDDVQNVTNKTFTDSTTFSDTTESTTKDTGAVIVEGGVGIEKNLNVGGNMVVAGDLEVNGTTTTMNTATLEIEDASIVINKNGNQASANLQDAGFVVEMSDATDAGIFYDSGVTSLFKLGNTITAHEVLTTEHTQTVQNKTIDGTAATGNNTISIDADDATYDNAISGLLATNVKTAIDELDAAIDGISGSSYVNSFNTRTGAVVPLASDYDAVQVDYDNSVSLLLATEVQAAIDELNSYGFAHSSDTSIHFTEGSIDHVNILNKGSNTHVQIDAHIDTSPTLHRTINDAGVGLTDLWSADKINTQLGTKSDTSHAHNADDLTDVDTTTSAPIAGEVLSWDGANWVPTTPGEVNTISNLGAGEGVYSTKVGADFKLKSLVEGTNVSITSDADTITINSTAVGGGETNTASNVGGETPVFKQKTGVDLEFFTLAEGANITLTPVGDTIEIASTATGGEGTTGGTAIEKNQTAHGFSVLDAIYHDGTSWEKAQANDAETLAEYVVTEVTDVDNFVAYKFGEVTVTSHGKTVGEHYFLSETVAGGGQTSEPGTYSSPLYYVEDVDTIHIEVYRPAEVSGTTPTSIDVPIVTEWESYTPVYRSLDGLTMSTATKTLWRRVGDTIEVQCHIAFLAGAGTNSSYVAVSIPTQFTMDATKLADDAYNPVGESYWMDGSDSNRTHPLITNIYPPDNSFFFYKEGLPSASASLNGTDLAISDRFQFSGKVPILEWEANQDLTAFIGPAGDDGNSWSDLVDSNIIPDTTDTYNLGSDTDRFKEIFFTDELSYDYGALIKGLTSINEELVTLRSFTDIDSVTVPGATRGFMLRSGDSTGATNINSGRVFLKSGDTSGSTGNSGDVVILSGDSTNGNSGNITLKPGSAGGTRGYIKNVADIIPAVNNTYDLGSSSLKFKDGYFQGKLTVVGGIDPAYLQLTPQAGDAGVPINSIYTDLNDDNKLKFKDNLGETAEVGSGTGVGSSSIFSMFNADSDKATDWDTSHLTSAIWGEEIVEPLHDDTSFKFANHASAAGEYVVSPNIEVPLRSRTKTIQKKFQYIYPGTNYAMKSILWDVTNNAEIDNKVLAASTVCKEGIFTFNLPDTCTQVQIRYESIIGEAVNLTIDDIELNDDAWTTASLVEPANTITKFLSAQVESDIVMPDLTFTDLEVGKEYEINGQVYFLINGGVANASCGMQIFNGLTQIAYPYFRVNSGTALDINRQSLSYKFTATNTELTFRAVSANSSSPIGGDGTTGQTFVQLSKVCNPKEHVLLSTEDTRNQAHFVGSAKYVLSADSVVSSTSYVLPTFSLTSSDFIGNVEQNTVNAPSITVPNAKKGTYVISATGGMGSAQAIQVFFRATDGTNFYSEQWAQGPVTPVHTFTVVHDTEGDLDIDIHMKVSANSASIGSNAPYELSINYLPPVEEASVATTFAVPAGEEQSYWASFDNGGDLISAFAYNTDKITCAWDGTPRAWIDYSAFGFTSPPCVEAVSHDSSVLHSVINPTNLGCWIYCRHHSTSALTAVNIGIKITKSGTDASPDRMYIGHVGGGGYNLVATKTEIEAASRTEGFIYYATDEDNSYSDDGTSLKLLGGESVSDPAIYAVLDCEDGKSLASAGWTQITGTGDTLEKDEATQLNGVAGLKYTMHTVGDKFRSKTFNLSDRTIEAIVNELNFIADYNGAKGDIEASAYDVTNGVTIAGSARDIVEGYERYAGTFNLPATCTAVAFEFEVKAFNSGKILRLDDIILKDAEFETANLVESSDTVTKYLSANVTSDQTMTDLTFSGLEIGKEYQIGGVFQIYLNFSGPDGNAYAYAVHDGATIIRIITNDSNTNAKYSDNSISARFVATTDTLTFKSGSTSAAAYIAGNGASTNTWVQLSKVNNPTKHVLVQDSGAGSQIIKYSNYSSGTTGGIKFATRDYSLDENGEDTSPILLDDNSGSFTKLTARIDSYFDIAFGGHNSLLHLGSYIERYNSSHVLQERVRAIQQIGTLANHQNVFSGNYRMNAGDYLRITGDQAYVDPQATYLIVKATPLKTPRVVALPASEQQDFHASFTSAGVLETPYNTNDITATWSGDHMVMDYSALGLSATPSLSAISTNSGAANMAIINATTTSASVYARNTDSTNYFATDFSFFLTKSGADARSLGVLCTSFRPKQLAYIDVHATGYTESITATTSYKKRSLVSLKGDNIAASIASNQLTLKAGTYDFRIPVGAYGPDNGVSMRLYRASGTAGVIEEFTDVAFDASGASRSINTVETTVSFTEDTTIEIQTKRDYPNGAETLSRISVERRQ